MAAEINYPTANMKGKEEAGKRLPDRLQPAWQVNLSQPSSWDQRDHKAPKAPAATNREEEVGVVTEQPLRHQHWADVVPRLGSKGWVPSGAREEQQHPYCKLPSQKVWMEGNEMAVQPGCYGCMLCSVWGQGFMLHCYDWITLRH